MSLYLHEQKLGSHSEETSSSNKFILKGRQTGSMHRGHTWVFRAESRDTMLAWYEDIKALTEKSPEERSQFVRTHSRSMSRSSRRSARSTSSDGLDDEDEEPFSAAEVDTNAAGRNDVVPRRPQPGGRFPSDIQVTTQRGLQASQSPSSLSSSGHQGYPSDTNVVTATTATSGGLSDNDLYANDDRNHGGYGDTNYKPMGEVSSQAAIAQQVARYDGVNPYTSEPVTHVTAQKAPNVVTGENSNRDESISTADQEAISANHKNEEPQSATKAELVTAVISRTDSPLESAGLEPVPEAGAIDHATPLEQTVTNELPVRSNRPGNNRTDSIQTIANLDIPGKFPKSTSALDATS